MYFYRYVDTFVYFILKWKGKVPWFLIEYDSEQFRFISLEFQPEFRVIDFCTENANYCVYRFNMF
jgi:hypothetical protein